MRRFRKRPSSATALAGFVRSRRKANSLSQDRLALLAGVGRRFVSDLENAKPTLRLDSVDAVLAIFGKQLGIVARKDLERP